MLLKEPVFREVDLENSLMDMGLGKVRVGRMKKVAWATNELPCVKQTASGNLLCDSGSSLQVSVTPRGVGWGGRLEGR